MLMKLYTYPITIDREGRKYYAYTEDFPGVYGLGKTIEEAKASVLEAIRIYVKQPASAQSVDPQRASRRYCSKLNRGTPIPRFPTL